jgi:hypothetical protein
MYRPNYSDYSLAELHDCLAHLDGQKYPERLQLLQDEMELRRAQGETLSDPMLNELLAEDVPASLGIRALWCFVWRMAAATFCCALLLKGCLWINTILHLLSTAALTLTLTILGTLFMTIAGTVIMSQVLAKRYHGYRIRIVSTPTKPPSNQRDKP